MGAMIPVATWDVNWQLEILRRWIAVSYTGALGNDNRPTEKEELWRKMDHVDAAAACLRKQNRHSSVQTETAHFHPSVHWLSCYDESLRGLSFPGCCVASLGHMSLLNNCSSERSSVRERGGDRNACWWWASDYCSWPLRKGYSRWCWSWAEVRWNDFVFVLLRFVSVGWHVTSTCSLSKNCQMQRDQKEISCQESTFFVSQKIKRNCHFHSCEPGVFGWMNCHGFVAVTLSLCTEMMQPIIGGVLSLLVTHLSIAANRKPSETLVG